MGITAEVDNLPQAILDSYESGVNTVSRLMSQAAGAVQGLQLKQEEMLADLRETLASHGSLRKKDFDSMMEDILARRRQREQEVAQAIEEFRAGALEMVAGLRRLLNSRQGYPTLEGFASLKRELLSGQQEREREAAEVLKEFHQEQEELTSVLNRLCAKGESATVRDFKSMIKALQLQQAEREKELGAMLKELERVDDEVRAAWQGLTVTNMRQRQV